jgi:hypothetical protein
VTPAIRYWINTISRAHVRIGAEGGFTQADHGKNTRLKRLGKGDLIAFYSPRTEFQSGEPLQAFTAIGRIADAEPYQVEMTPEFHPWRRSVDFFESEAAPIRPLIDELGFIRNEDVVVRLRGAVLDPAAVSRFLDYLDLESIRRRSELAEADAQALASEVDQTLWERTRLADFP